MNDLLKKNLFIHNIYIMNKEFYSVVSPCSNMLDNSTSYSNYNNNNDDNNDNMNNKKKRKINMIFSLFITFFAMYLAYDCNKCESMGMRIFYTKLLFIFIIYR